MINIWIVLLGVAICLGLIIVTSTVDDEQGSDKTVRVIISVINSLIVMLLVLPSGANDSVWTLIEMRGLIIAGLALVNVLIAYFWFYRHKGDSDMFYGHLGCNIGLIVLGLYMRNSEKDAFETSRGILTSSELLPSDTKKRDEFMQRISKFATQNNLDRENFEKVVRQTPRRQDI